MFGLNNLKRNKTMRTIKELLELMLENQQSFKTGLCYFALDLYYEDIITPSEYRILQNYIDSNKPTFFESPFYSFGIFGCYYWKKGNVNPRLKWIKKHIKLNS